MPNYKKMYYDLFNSVTDTIEALKKAQQKAEEEYINSSEEDAEKLIKLKTADRNQEHHQGL